MLGREIKSEAGVSTPLCFLSRKSTSLNLVCKS